MKIPQKPPSLQELFRQANQEKRLDAVIEAIPVLPQSRRYRHWDKLRRLSAPPGLSHGEWWLGIKLQRSGDRRSIALQDTSGRAFSLTTADPIGEYLHEIDRRTGHLLPQPDPIGNPDLRDRYIVHSLMEEAITSSQLEGAATTRRVAKEMIRAGRPPRDRSEQMILNNYLAMQELGKLRDKPLTLSTLLHLHKIVTSKTLDDPADAGRFRRSDRVIDVGDPFDQALVFHRPPPAEQLEERVKAMCEFAEGKSPKGFIHPVVRSIILHFWLAYDHPFVDGNGRTARTLFYWSMLHHGYWLCEFISISEIIRKAPAKYGRAFLYTETDENDLTYFILYHLEVIHRAIRALQEYVDRKARDIQSLERRMRAIAVLNHRQQALISHALRHPEQRYTIESHQRSHNVVYQTARTDLLELAKRGLLRSWKLGREWRFEPAEDLDERLSNSERRTTQRQGSA
jgi:Fic family protein